MTVPRGRPVCRSCRRWDAAELGLGQALAGSMPEKAPQPHGTESPDCSRPIPAALWAHGAPSPAHRALTRGEAVPGRAGGPGRAGRGRPLRLLARGRGAPPGRLLGGARRCRRRQLGGRGLGPEGLAELLHQAVHAVCRGRRGPG